MKNRDIRKKETFNEYFRLIEEDVNALVRFDKMTHINCPACNGKIFDKAFEKTKFTYVECSSCNTLFANPRPSPENIIDFYRDSKSERYWVDEFFTPMIEARREKIFKPRVDEFLKRFTDEDMSDMIIGDIGAGFGIFLEELKKKAECKRLFAIEPSLAMADICRSKGLEVINKGFEDVTADEQNRFNILTSFELLEHLIDPYKFMLKVNDILGEKGYFMFTTLNGGGFDIQLLKEKCKAVFPPIHINFFNPESVRILAERSGFEVLDISTPGQLDWDKVECVYREEATDIGYFWRQVADNVSEEGKKSFQKWLSKNGLSSYMEVLLRKK
jgi:2-polyprenyl-3-methyl-5-hydroxy-6-metoxy-1,4-benzoquinol methylase